MLRNTSILQNQETLFLENYLELINKHGYRIELVVLILWLHTKDGVYGGT